MVAKNSDDKSVVVSEDASMAHPALATILKPVNRPRMVEHTTKKFLYKLYLFLRKQSEVKTYVKQRAFEAAADSADAWRIVAISLDALLYLEKEDTPKGLRRGHAVNRAERAIALFDSQVALTAENLISYFFVNDTVALITKHENGTNNLSRWSALYEVPSDVFNANSYSVRYRKKTERAWVHRKLREIESQQCQPFWSPPKPKP